MESLLTAGIFFGLATGVGIGAGIMFAEVIAITSVVTGGLSIAVGGVAFGIYSLAIADWDRIDVVKEVHKSILAEIGKQRPAMILGMQDAWEKETKKISEIIEERMKVLGDDGGADYKNILG